MGEIGRRKGRTRETKERKDFWSTPGRCGRHSHESAAYAGRSTQPFGSPFRNQYGSSWEGFSVGRGSQEVQDPCERSFLRGIRAGNHIALVAISSSISSHPI